MDNIFERSLGLLGEDNFEILKNKVIAIFGLGGVGGTALLSLLRTGFSSFIIIDFDKVMPSNLNRQILFNHFSIGLSKVQVAKEEILKFNPQAKVITIDKKVDDLFFLDFKKYHIDYIIDAIDDVNGKINIVKFSLTNHIPFIISLGMANRIDSTKVIITTLDKTDYDPLAKKMRSVFRKNGIDLKKINCVFSKELPYKDGKNLHSIITVPSSAGLAISSKIIKDVLTLKENK